EGAAKSEHGVEGDVESVDVVEREEAKHRVGRREMRGVGGGELVDVSDQIVVREHYALRKTGGSAGVGKGRDGFAGRLRRLRNCCGHRFQQIGKVVGALGSLACAIHVAKVG